MGEIREVSQLPKAITRFLADLKAVDYGVEFLKKYATANELNKTSDLLALIWRVAFGTSLVEDLPEILSKDFNIPQDFVKNASIDLVINRILPFSDILDIDVESALLSWGADPVQFANIPRIQAEKSVELVEPSPLHQTLAAKGAVFSDPIMQHRLELILASYRDGVRTKEQATAVLMRSVKTGGLEMGEVEAGEVLGLVGPVDTNPQIGYQTTNQPIATDGFVVASAATQSVDEDSVSGAKVDHFTDSDAAEVAAIANAKKAALEVPTLITDTKAAADRIVAETKVSFASGELRTRFDHIVDARLRDVRDGFGTREKLEASVESGGVGMSGPALVAVMEMVESMDAMHHLALGAKTDYLKEKIATEKAAKAESVEAAKAQDAQVMSQRYAEITGKAPDAHVEPSTTARASVAIPAAQATEQRMQNIDTSKVRAAIEATKPVGPVVTPVMSAATISTTTAGRPIVEDIRFERKLAGPVEELRMLTLSDFRRLSSDPKQAILRIRDKVELAAQEGYEHRIAAIKAWRESPLSQLYVSVSREALMGGKSIVDVLTIKRSTGEDTLREDELHAVVELNGVLRF